jgi:predicted TIM-barrel fold metal-dependent hydrolase
MAIRRREFLSGVAAAAGAAPLLKSGGARAQQQQQQGGRGGRGGGVGGGSTGDALKPQRAQKFTYTKPVIDAHFHWHPPEFLELVEKEGPANGLWRIGRAANGNFTAMLPGYHPYTGGGITVPAKRNPDEIDQMLAHMAERKVDMCTVTQTNPHVVWAPPAFGLKLAQTINDATSALCAKYPKKFTAAVTLPLQDPKASLVELERAHKLPGMKAVNMTENINNNNLGDKQYWPIFEAVEALNMPIFLHNVDPLWQRLVEPEYTMINVLGNPFEATMAAMSLVLSGAMDQFPKLDVFFPHAAGFFAFVTPRADWSMGTAAYQPRGRTNSFATLKQTRVSDYRRRFHYDLIMHDPAITRMLIEIVGADRVTCGTDYPQGMGVMKPVEYVEAIPGITQKEAETILCDNPARLLRL